MLSLFFIYFFFFTFSFLNFFFFPVPSLRENQIHSIWLHFKLQSSIVISSSSFLFFLLFSLGTKWNFEPYFDYHNQATTTPTTKINPNINTNPQNQTSTPKSTTTMTSYDHTNPNLPSLTIYNNQIAVPN